MAIESVIKVPLQCCTQVQIYNINRKIREHTCLGVSIAKLNNKPIVSIYRKLSTTGQTQGDINSMEISFVVNISYIDKLEEYEIHKTLKCRRQRQDYILNEKRLSPSSTQS